MQSPGRRGGAHKETDAHVSAQRDLVVRQLPLRDDVPERAHAVHKEAVDRNFLLEALQAAPCTKGSAHKMVNVGARVQRSSRRTKRSKKGGDAQVMFCSTIRAPSAMRSKSASPCAITTRALFSITPGRTVNAGGRDESPCGKTSSCLITHAFQFLPTGAWIAAWTSVRLK